jgi:glutaredoxin
MEIFTFSQSVTAMVIALCSATSTMLPLRANPANSSVPANSSLQLPALTQAQIPTEPKIETVSGAAELALAKHLTAKNVKFYGAYWCDRCLKQKSLFGAEATSKLLYVECAAGGVNSQRQLCKEKNIQMFPTWVINGQYFAGMRDLKEIASITDYKGPTNFKYHK